jgi:tRNA threonylcarbamoyladenosine biosynthesis protein TsaB
MTLYINTVLKDEIIIALREGNKIIAQKKMPANHNQAEKLVPGIDRLLKSRKIKLSALKKIIVANRGGSFTALRIGVITANALAYALKIPVVAEEPEGGNQKKFRSYNIVEPFYDREPNIGAPKNSGLS